MDGGAGASAIPIYHRFVEVAKQMKPNYLSLIMPARWYTGGRGLEAFRQAMLEDIRMERLIDHVDAQSIFENVEIKGGICYFLWNTAWKQACKISTYVPDQSAPLCSTRYLKEGQDAVFIRDPRVLAIKNAISQVSKQLREKTFDSVVSSMKPYGLRGDFFKEPAKYNLPPVSRTPIKGGITIVGLGDKSKRTFRYAPKDYPLLKADGLTAYKVFIPRNWGTGKLQDSTYKTYLAEPNEACTETFVQVYPFATIEERDNCNRYMQTKFFRMAVSMRKQDQGAGREVYAFVPLQDFTANSEIDWSTSIAEIDQQLYRKYGLSPESIQFIERMIKPME